MRELVPQACVKLRAPTLPPAWAKVEADAAPQCMAKADELRSLVERLRASVPEFRSKKALAYPLAGTLALITQALFSSVRRGPHDLAEYAATLSQGQLRALGFRPERKTGRLRCPGVTPDRTPPRAGVRQIPDCLALTQMKKCVLSTLAARNELLVFPWLRV